MKQVGGILAGAFIIVFALFFSGLILSFPVMWLWNFVMPSIFHLPQIGYWQSFALYYLCGILLKGISPKAD